MWKGSTCILYEPKTCIGFLQSSFVDGLLGTLKILCMSGLSGSLSYAFGQCIDISVILIRIVLYCDSMFNTKQKGI